MATQDEKVVLPPGVALLRSQAGFAQECARADFYGEPRPEVFKKLKRKLTQAQLKSFLNSIATREEYIRHLSKLNADPTTVEKREELRRPPFIVSKIPGMSLGKILSLWQNTIQALADPRRKRFHIQARIVLDSINDDWQRRSQALNSEGYFSWPSTDASDGNGSLSAQGWPSEGMLSCLGYHVGVVQGETANVRQSVLREIFSAFLPPILPPLLMLEWGHPKSAGRLKKMAECIAAFSRNAKRRHDPRLSTAIAQWDDDLEYLYNEYYVGTFHFAWPSSLLPPV